MFREMRRAKQQLSREECEEVLASAPRGVLSVLGENGYPYGVPLNFMWHEGKLYFHGAREGHKLDALAAHDKASFTVLDEGTREEGQWWLTFRSVIVFGRVRRIEDEARAREILMLIGQRYFPPEKDVAESVEHSMPRVAMLEMCIDHLSGKRVQEK